MKLQVKPERWLCLATSFAMAVDVPVAEFLARIGHDGSQVVFSSFPEPANRRGHHPQECIEVCLKLGYAVTPVELFPSIATREDDRISDYQSHLVIYPGGKGQNWMHFIGQIQRSRGIITGLGNSCGHAVAFDHGQIFDPDGVQYEYSREICERHNFITRCVWRIDPIGKEVHDGKRPSD